MSEHVFACYALEVPIEIYDVIVLKNEFLINRILNVLRHKVNDKIILFDLKKIYHCIVQGIHKKKIELKIEKYCDLEPRGNYNFYLPLLEKDYLEQALYSCAIYGINKITIVNYAKSKQTWGKKEKDWQRAYAILIAACEQSKQFNIPVISSKIISFHEIPQNQTIICAQINGNKNVYEVFKRHKHQEQWLTCGPEAGFTDVEEGQFSHAQSVHLSNSILRSCDAISHLCVLTQHKE